jgi:hypothetical protein
MEALFPLVLAVSQWLLGSTVTACPVEGITEVHTDGTYVGAIAECSEASFGVTFKADGSIVIEDRRS